MQEYEFLRKKNWVGFAAVYLYRFYKESDADVTADTEIYAQLVKLDERLGTTASDQLFDCLSRTTPWDIMKVLFEDFDYQFKIILDN